MTVTHAPRVSSGSITQFQAIRNFSGTVVGASTNLNSIMFDGLALSSGTNGNTVYIIENGTVNPNIFNLGDGYACAIGVNSSGIPVRITDSSCVSVPNYLGACDGYGTITIQPYRTEELNIIDFGAVPGDSSLDTRLQNNNAITFAMRSQSISGISGFANQTGAVVRIPTGDWYLAHTVDITRPIHLLGVRGKLLPGAVIYIPDGYVGIKVWADSSQVGFPDVSTAGASGAVIEGIYLHAETAYASTEGSNTAYGIFVNALAHISHCVIENFGGHGIYISSENEGFPDNWQVDWTRVTFCQDGIHIVGGDANNGVCNHGDFQGNRGWGVWGHSFLGDSFIECHCAENAAGAYNIYAVGVSTLLNCYSEGDCPSSQISGNVFVIGGEQGSPITSTSTFFGGGSAGELQSSSFIGKANASFPQSGSPFWSTGLSITTGDLVVSGSNGVPSTGYIYQAQNDGTTGSSSPNFSNQIGETVNDNGVTWKTVGIEPKITVITGDVTDALDYTIQVVQDGYPAGRDAFFPYTSSHAQILKIRYTTDSGSTWIYFTPTRADYGYDFGVSQHELGFSNIHTTVASGSDGYTLPQSIINVASTSLFSSSGILLLESTSGLQSITYTGTTSTTFTGCSGGIGTLATGNDGYQGGSGTNIYFTPYYYYLNNTWTGSSYVGLPTYFQGGSQDSTFAAYGWGHVLAGDTENDPRIDTGSPWRIAYNLSTGRWIQSWANSEVFKEWAGSRSLPTPGAELFDGGMWSGNETFGFNNLSWYDASYARTNDNFLSHITRGTGWYSVGDLLLNRNQTGTNYPIGLRAFTTGGFAQTAGYGYNTNWAAGRSIRVGDTIRPSTPNGYIWRAQPGGLTGSVEPTWTSALGLGATINDNGITWTNVGIEDGYNDGYVFEPVLVASPTLGIKDCTAGGTITLTFDEISHERYKLTGSPSGDFTVVIGVGAGDSWDRSVWNTTGHNATIKATVGDTGIVIPTVTAYRIFSDGTNTIRVT